MRLSLLMSRDVGFCCRKHHKWDFPHQARPLTSSSARSRRWESLRSLLHRRSRGMLLRNTPFSITSPKRSNGDRE